MTSEPLQSIGLIAGALVEVAYWAAIGNERPLPKRLKADETWETWIGVEQIPAALSNVEAFRLSFTSAATTAISGLH